MNKRHKIYLFYGICVCLVLYFLNAIITTSYNITEKELYEKSIKEKSFQLNIFDLNTLNKQDKTYLTYGEYIWKICTYILNIIFTLVIMLKIYIDEDE